MALPSADASCAWACAGKWGANGMAAHSETPIDRPSLKKSVKGEFQKAPVLLVSILNHALESGELKRWGYVTQRVTSLNRKVPVHVRVSEI